jgi:murein DD-endopeptidase MepM/ murein hydrolase activator NlpD
MADKLPQITPTSSFPRRQRGREMVRALGPHVARYAPRLLVLGLAIGVAVAIAAPGLSSRQPTSLPQGRANLGLTTRGMGAVQTQIMEQQEASEAGEVASSSASSAPRGGSVLDDDEGLLVKVPALHTTVPKRPRTEIIIYTVEEGDNVSTIAERFDIDTDTVIWANDKLEEDPDYLVVGQELIILPIVGVLHTVKEGDTIDSIAQKYKADPQVIVDYEFNHLQETGVLKVGQQIIVPNGQKPYQLRYVYTDKGMIAVNAPQGSGRFIWPTSGYITNRFSPTHLGIDIGAPLGTPVYAADAGVVTSAGPMGTYGLAVIIDHGKGFTTLYAHLSMYYPTVGTPVRKGQAIGKIGLTGKTTGPHLHFEIRYNGGAVNPLNYLP